MNCLFILNLFLIVILSDSGNAKVSEAPILRGVTIRNWPYADRLENNYKGFAVDLMNEIAIIVGFQYELYFSPDGKYGFIKDGKVNGMIGEVFNNRADFAIADITVTDARKKYVDFTEPFIETGISALIHKSNIGNMKSFKDLADQHEILYGSYRMGSTYNSFSESRDPTIRKMYLYMARNPDVLVDNSKEGVNRVNNSRYAFIIETSLAEFLSGKYCNLTYIEDKLSHFPRQYAIALPKDSPLKKSFNNAIKELKASGTLDRLEAKYWNNECADS
jgi:ABC-type amino acid transport substrate-binding protein